MSVGEGGGCYVLPWFKVKARRLRLFGECSDSDWFRVILKSILKKSCDNRMYEREGGCAAFAASGYG